MTRMTYAEQLKHPKWQKRRLEILDRAKFRCESCEDSETTLHVHHKRYRKGAMAWEYSDQELIALCEDCHESEHSDSVDVGPGEFRAVVAILATFRSRLDDDELTLRVARATYFENPDPVFEAERARQLSELRRRMANA